MSQTEVFLLPPLRSELLEEQGDIYPLSIITDNDLSDGVYLRQIIGIAAQYCTRVTALYCSAPALATLRDVHHAETYRAALEYVIDQSPNNLFDFTILECSRKQDNLEAGINVQRFETQEELQVRLALSELMEAAGDEHTQNMLAHKDFDEIFPPPSEDGTQPPATFPRTIFELRHLQDDNLLTEIEKFYGLPPEADLADRIHNIRRTYGIIRFARAPEA